MMRTWVALGISMERVSWDSKPDPLSLRVCSIALLLRLDEISIDFMT